MAQPSGLATRDPPTPWWPIFAGGGTPRREREAPLGAAKPAAAPRGTRGGEGARGRSGRRVPDGVARAHADPLRDRAVLLQLLGESLLGTHRLVSRLRRGSHAAEQNVRAGAAWVVSGGPVGTGGDAQRALRRSGAPPWAAGAGGLFSPWRRPRAQNKDAPPAPNPVADRREDENWEFLALAGAAAQCPQPRTRAMSASCERALLPI